MFAKKHLILTVSIILVITVLFLGGVTGIILSLIGPSPGLGFSNKIGVINIRGTITDPEPFLGQLVEFKKNKQIRAIILRIDSSGGGVGASQEIYREVRKVTETKNVIVSLGAVAASGGYYIASAGDRIIANPGTITGSIGVKMEIFQIQELSEKIGIGMEVLKSGEFKDIGSPYRELTEEEEALIKELLSDIQEQFINAVSEGRNIPSEKVREIADGRIFTGSTALDLGLVDQLGNFRDAVDLAKKMAGIEGEPRLVYPTETRFRLWDLILQDATKALYSALKDSVKPAIEYRWNGN
jgi:protease-4